MSAPHPLPQHSTLLSRSLSERTSTGAGAWNSLSDSLTCDAKECWGLRMGLDPMPVVLAHQ